MKTKTNKTKKDKMKTQKRTITKKMTFFQILNKKPESANILFESGLHCVGCGAAMHETLEQGCLMHGFSKSQIDELIERLNS